MVQGNLSERAVHIVELCRSPVETVLSRSYGSMPRKLHYWRSQGSLFVSSVDVCGQALLGAWFVFATSKGSCAA